MKKYQIVGIGNAIVDVFTQSDEAFLAKMGIEKGIMQLVERERGELLYAAMNDRVQAPGGSVANSLAGLGNLGLKTAFIGRVHDDALGRFYAKGMAEDGTDFVNPPVQGGELPTSRSMIFVSKDGERSMNTYLGISSELGPQDVSDEVAGDTDYLFLEGYLYDKPKGKEAFERAAKLCQKTGGKAGIALSDPFCVDRHRDDFRKLVENHVDILFANEDEIKSLYQVKSFEEAAAAVNDKCEIAVLTRSEKGAVVLSNGEQIVVSAAPVTKVIDTTGAGDQFAAGFLYGFTEKMPLEKCGKLGAAAAAEVIGHIGPRPQMAYRDLIKKAA